MIFFSVWFACVVRQAAIHLRHLAGRIMASETFGTNLGLYPVHFPTEAMATVNIFLLSTAASTGFTGIAHICPSSCPVKPIDRLLPVFVIRSVALHHGAHILVLSSSLVAILYTEM